jgi:NAD-dependent dihydropyrimidine dehydrogenase PreA subunit
VIDKAITLDPQTNARTGKHTLFIPVVHSDHCTGCGKCEKPVPPRWPRSRCFRSTWPRAS